MRQWERALDSLDTPGGHILVLLALMTGGVVMVLVGIAKGEDVLIGAFAALLAVLRGALSNHSRENGTTTGG